MTEQESIVRSAIAMERFDVTDMGPKASEIARLNDTAVIMPPHVTLGYFTCELLKTAVLYHELAHIKLRQFHHCTYEQERAVWINAFELMKKDGFYPPYSVLKKCVIKLNKVPRDVIN